MPEPSMTEYIAEHRTREDMREGLNRAAPNPATLGILLGILPWLIERACLLNEISGGDADAYQRLSGDLKELIRRGTIGQHAITMAEIKLAHEQFKAEVAKTLEKT